MGRGKKKRKSGSDVRLQWERKQAAFDEKAGFRCIESYDAPGEQWRNPLIMGDNLSAMQALHEIYAGKISLIYIDPPYGTGRKFKSRLRSRKGETPPLDGSAFDDAWGGGLSGYLDAISARLAKTRELLAEDGSIYVHADWRAVHYIKVLMDEIFGRDAFQNEIAWCYREAVNSKKRWNRKHDTILFYSKGKEFTFNYEEVLEKHAESTIKKYRRIDERGPYRLMGRGLRGSPIRSARDVAPRWEEERPELTYRHYLPKGRLAVDYWNIDIVNQAAHQRTGYATQKPEPLLEKIIKASSNPGDIVADFFCGSGTTVAVASRLGRRWIGCDAAPGAIHVARKRLLELDASPCFEILTLSGDKTRGDGGELDAALVDCGQGFFQVELRGYKPVWTQDAGDGAPTGDGLDLLDFWAIDPSFRRLPLRPVWWDFKTRKHKEMQMSSKPFRFRAGQKREVAVLVADISGARVRLKLTL